MVDAVLVVEDDTAVRELVARLLHLQGFAPITARNGQEALMLLRIGVPAKVILLDMAMPVMDGWTFRREQQRDPTLAHIPVVMLGSSVDESANELQPAAVFQKPVDFDDMIDVVRLLCRARSASHGRS